MRAAAPQGPGKNLNHLACSLGSWQIELLASFQPPSLFPISRHLLMLSLASQSNSTTIFSLLPCPLIPGSDQGPSAFSVFIVLIMSRLVWGSLCIQSFLAKALREQSPQKLSENRAVIFVASKELKIVHSV